MKKIFLLTILLCSNAYAEEVMTGLDPEKDTPVLNEILRQKDANLNALETRVVTLEATPSSIAATQAQQEATASTTTYVSPGRQQYHPSAAKAWCSFNGSGTPAMNGSPYNFSSTIVDDAAGSWKLNFITPMSTSNYAVIGTANDVTGSAIAVTCATKSTTQITIKARQTDNQTSVDPTWVDVLVMGDQ